MTFPSKTNTNSITVNIYLTKANKMPQMEFFFFLDYLIKAQRLGEKSKTRQVWLGRVLWLSDCTLLTSQEPFMRFVAMMTQIIYKF